MQYIVFISNYGNMMTYGSKFDTLPEAQTYCDKFKTYCVIYESNGTVMFDRQVANVYKKPLVVKPKNESVTLYECPKPMENAYYILNRWFFGNI